MFNSLFKIIYFIEFMMAVIVRKSYERKYLKLDIDIQKKTGLDIAFLFLNGIGMTIPLVYVWSTWLDFANYSLPDWLAWVGVVLFALAIFCIGKSHNDLGRNWTPTVAMRHDPVLITKGIYKHIRHPMYSAHLMWAIAQILMLHNWIAGYSFLVVQVPFYIYRIRKEEEMMLEQFGEVYSAYMKKTNRLFPKLRK